MYCCYYAAYGSDLGIYIFHFFLWLGFTFGDLFLGVAIVYLGLYFLNFFANNGNRHVDDSSEGVKY